MPISIKSVDLEYILLPISLFPDGTCSVTVRKGYKDNGEFVTIEGNTVIISELDVSAMLDSLPTAGLTRREDMSLAVYQYLADNNHVEAGIIS
jgi:hypothetical protein